MTDLRTCKEVVPLVRLGTLVGAMGASFSELPSLRLQCQCLPWSYTAQQSCGLGALGGKD